MDTNRNYIDAVDTSDSTSLTTRRAVLAAGGTVALAGLAGCTALDGLLDRASEELVGTTVSAPAAFYAGRPASDATASIASNRAVSDGAQFFSSGTMASTQMGSDAPMAYRTGSTDVRHVPATVRADSREIDLEGWAISGSTKAQCYNSSRSNKPSSEWWGGPDDDIDDDDSDGDGILDALVAIQATELDLLGHVAMARDAVERREQSAAIDALDAFIDTTTKALRPELDTCGTGVCETVRENSDHRTKAIRQANDAVADGNWDEADALLQEVDEIVIGDIERLDEELVERRPGRPKYSDIVLYLRDEPTIGERFTVCLPDAKLPGDRGSLAETLTPERVLSFFAASIEEGGRHTPFHNKYRPVCCFDYDDDRRCIELDGPVSLHTDIACGNIISAELDTYTTENRAIVGYSTEGGAVVSGAPASADTDGKCVFVAADGTLREPAVQGEGNVQCWGQDRSEDNGTVYCWGQYRSAGDASVSQTLVCPVTVTPEDCPCPLPGLFYVRRILHDDQVIFAGGWVLDEGALHEGSVTLLFDEGPTEVASVTPEDIESDDSDDRIIEQFSRGRSEQGSAVISGGFDADGDGIPAALQSGEGRNGLNAVNVKVLGEQGDGDFNDPDDDGDGVPDGLQFHASVTALDAPLVHLAGAANRSNDVKFKAGAELSKSVN